MSGAADRAARWTRPEVQALEPYAVTDAAGLIKLDAMESPYEWPDRVVEPWLEAVRHQALNRYPDPHCRALKTRIAGHLALPEEWGLVLGNGSDELIQLVLTVFGGPGRALVTPEPGFAMYRILCQLAGMRYTGVSLGAGDFSLDRSSMLEAIEAQQPAVVFLAYPNNPTGNLFDEGDVRAVIEAAPGVVVIDEAYAPYADASLLAAAQEYDHVLVMRTYSKVGMAGLRLGLVVGPTPWTETLEKARLPYNVNVLTQASAEVALRYADAFREQIDAVLCERERLFRELRLLPGIVAYPSHTNFILVRTPSGRGRQIFDSLRGQGVLVKNLSGSSPALSDCLRVTVGRPEENRAFLAALRTALPRPGRSAGTPAGTG